MLRKILLGLLVVVVALQFFQISKENPESDPKIDFMYEMQPPVEVKELVEAACYDCHSNQTKYPWYSYVQPVGWFVGNHIEEGREHLNFSVWGDYKPGRAAHKLEECFEEIEKGKMPEDSYTWMHSEARLTDEQKALLINWFKQAYENSEVKILSDEVMDIHDEVMPKMDDLVALRMKLEASLVAKKGDPETIQAKILELKVAEEGMMSWMRGYEIAFEGSKEERMNYHAAEKEKISQVSEAMKSALSSGQDLLDSM